jgi:RND superfamily putative drug exporter
VNHNPIIKSMGSPLAIGGVIDPFVVRMTTVPAVMSPLGRAAWWLPGWLAKTLPNVDIESQSRCEHRAAQSDRECELVRVE